MGSNEIASSLTFPIKLKSIVDAPETDHLIYWDEDGNSFHIADENQFARDIIPNYFKHSNISSFIRQLNMYGFHKRNRIDNGLAIIGSGNDDSQWVHPNFIRDKPELLSSVIRKPVSNANANEIVPYDSTKSDIARLAKMVQFLKKRDEETTEQLKALQIENQELYTELMSLRDQHEQQSKCIDMLIEFFSQYANKPQMLASRLKPKRNILALECLQPRTNNIQGNIQEPPRKYFITSPSDSAASSPAYNDVFKGKKVIKISNSSQPSHIDINTPRIINSLSNTHPYHMPILSNTQSQKQPVIYTLSLPKNTNNSLKPIRAITSSNPIITQSPKPSLLPFSLASSSNHSIVIPRSNNNTKSVTVSTINSSSESNYKAHHANKLPTRQNTNRDISHCSPTNVSQQLAFPNDNNQSAAVSNIVSGISSNVNSVERFLDDLTDMFDTDQSYDNVDKNDDADWTMLLDNIKTESLLRNNTDSSQIQGHELIPFIGSAVDTDTDTANHDTYSIDDLLQTPDIHPGMSSLSLDYLDDTHWGR